MAKKRNCRRNEKEREIHDRAVSLRKMPDHQLVERFDKHYKAGFDAGSIGIETAEQEAVRKIIEAITGIKGIGAATMGKIRDAAQEIVGGMRHGAQEADGA